VLFSSGDKALIKNWVQKIQFLENIGRIFEDKLQQGKSGNVINKDLRNMQHRSKACDQET